MQRLVLPKYFNTFCLTHFNTRLQMFFKIGALNIFAKFHSKPSALQSLFSKVAGLRTATLLKSTTKIFEPFSTTKIFE